MTPEQTRCVMTQIVMPMHTNGVAGVIQGVPRLGLPPIQRADSAVGVRAAAERGRYATLLPSTLAAAAPWDLNLALEYGEVIGRELRDQQDQAFLGAAVNPVP